jgi:hypothetical protein
MLEFIVNETQKIFTKAIKRYAKDTGGEEDFASILLRLEMIEEDKQVVYDYCYEGVEQKRSTIKEILNVKIDMKGYSVLVPPHIRKFLLDFETELGTEDVSVMIYLNREDYDSVRFFLYKSTDFVREVYLEQLIQI